MNIDEHIDTVKSLLSLFRRSANNNPAAATWSPKLEALSNFLGEQKRLATPIPKDLGDISDLPEELIRELSVKRTDELEDQILAVMRACDGGHEVNLDQILVGLFRKFKVVQARRFLNNKLYRMYKKDLVYPVAGRRAYSLEPQPEVEEAQLGTDEGYGAGGYGEPPRPAVNPSRGPNPDLDDEIPF